jgi:hypothetical protein
MKTNYANLKILLDISPRNRHYNRGQEQLDW